MTYVRPQQFNSPDNALRAAPMGVSGQYTFSMSTRLGLTITYMTPGTKPVTLIVPGNPSVPAQGRSRYIDNLSEFGYFYASNDAADRYSPYASYFMGAFTPNGNGRYFYPATVILEVGEGVAEILEQVPLPPVAPPDPSEQIVYQDFYSNGTMGNPDRYEWVFSDGRSFEGQINFGTNELYSIPILANSETDVTLTVWRGGESDSITKTVGPFDLPNELVAQFVVDTDGLTVEVDASASYSTETDIVSYTWDWDDGSEPETFNTPTASHTYENYSGYTIRLDIEDDQGSTTWTQEGILLEDPYLPSIIDGNWYHTDQVVSDYGPFHYSGPVGYSASFSLSEGEGEVQQGIDEGVNDGHTWMVSATWPEDNAEEDLDPVPVGTGPVNFTVREYNISFVHLAEWRMELRDQDNQTFAAMSLVRNGVDDLLHWVSDIFVDTPFDVPFTGGYQNHSAYRLKYDPDTGIVTYGQTSGYISGDPVNGPFVTMGQYTVPDPPTAFKARAVLFNSGPAGDGSTYAGSSASMIFFPFIYPNL